ncbi:MAG TPA: PP2C family serine/threonine-protein phosphatase [Pirellulales bacterium]|nr:PP2C family serine/threonine-protein phosphatase [Pirellulales bacterium]
MDNKAASWQSYLEYAELSDVGLRRSNNQDSLGSVISGSEDSWRRRGHLFMVADGMGAHAAGELASKMAVDTVLLTYYKLPDPSAPDAFKKALEDANAKINARGQANPDFKGMGTTTSALAVLPQGAVVAHVGDSRAYRLRGNRLEQLSADHSLVWEMMAASKISERDLPTYIPKNVITRSLGPNPTVQVDLEGPFPLVPGDTFLLCSDGLSGQVSDEEIGAVLQALPPHEAVQTLVDLANLRGGPDNISVIVVRVTALPSASGASGAIAAPANPSGDTRIHPAFWIVFGVALAAALILFLIDMPLFAAASAVAAVITLGAALVSKASAVENASFDGEISTLGGGPYRSLVCNPDRALIDRLKSLIESIRQSASEQQWQIEWSTADAYVRRSEQAAAQENNLLAVRELFHAISYLMKEARQQRQARDAG